MTDLHLIDIGDSVMITFKDGNDNGSPITSHNVYLNNFLVCNSGCTVKYSQLLNWFQTNDVLTATVTASNIFGDSTNSSSNSLLIKGYDQAPVLQGDV